MTDLDEFLELVGSEPIEEHRKCPQRGCNKMLATMEEALKLDGSTIACDHCFRIYIPSEADRSPAVIRKGRERFQAIDGTHVEYDAEYYEDGTKKIFIKTPKAK